MSLMGSHHRAYDGLAFRRTRDGLVRISLRSNIMIDTEQFRKTIPSYARIITKKTEEGFFSDVVTMQQRVMKCDMNSANLADDQLVLCPPTVLGFSLDEKFWGECTLTLVVCHQMLKFSCRRVRSGPYPRHQPIFHAFRPFIHPRQREEYHQIRDSWSSAPTGGWEMVRLEHECHREWNKNIASVRFFDFLHSPCTLTEVVDRQAWERFSRPRRCQSTTSDHSIRYMTSPPLLTSEANDLGICWRTELRCGRAGSSTHQHLPDCECVECHFTDRRSGCLPPAT